jgi:hypothetical protein
MPPAPHRLRLSAADYAYLVQRLELSMPPGWEPDPEAGERPRPEELAKRGVLRDDDVHPSVVMNFGILAGPKVMLDTTASIGAEGSHGLHAVVGPLGASLFALADGAVEVSMFAATDLGNELVRAVPSEEDSGIDSALGDGRATEPPRGRVPLAALHELGVAELLRGADPEAPNEVLAKLRLPAEQAELAAEVARRTNGALVCQVTARVDDEVRTARVSWLHTDAGWSGLRPDPAGQRMVQLEPVGRADLGVWVAPYVAEALDD